MENQYIRTTWLRMFNTQLGWVDGRIEGLRHDLAANRPDLQYVIDGLEEVRLNLGEMMKALKDGDGGNVGKGSVEEDIASIRADYLQCAKEFGATIDQFKILQDELRSAQMDVVILRGERDQARLKAREWEEEALVAVQDVLDEQERFIQEIRALKRKLKKAKKQLKPPKLQIRNIYPAPSQLVAVPGLSSVADPTDLQTSLYDDEFVNHLRPTPSYDRKTVVDILNRLDAYGTALERTCEELTENETSQYPVGFPAWEKTLKVSRLRLIEAELRTFVDSVLPAPERPTLPPLLWEYSDG